MNDEEYILAGVELADGWHTLENAVGFLEVVKTYHGFGGPDSDKEIIDALAAQLERQYLAAVAARAVRISYMTEARRMPVGTDLTMWRIRYFVDSEVLK